MSDTKQILSPYFKSIVDQDRLSIVICDLEHTIYLYESCCHQRLS